jgi:FixJ family two-component response regulator
MSAAKKQGIVYLVDDDESTRKALVKLLGSVNLNVETFSSADEFLNSPKQKGNSCILIDIRMLGSNGFDLRQKLAAADLRIPIITISASDEGTVREEARKVGAVSFFRKPVDDQALLDAIWWAIAGSRKNR